MMKEKPISGIGKRQNREMQEHRVSWVKTIISEKIT